MIAPTSRAILLAALGAPLTLALAVMQPALWPVGAVWGLTVAALILVDGLLASARAR